MRNYAKKINRAWFALLCTVTVVSAIAVEPGTLPKPAPPSKTVPAISAKLTSIICVDCDLPFEFSGHKAANAGLLKDIYMNELRNAMYWQDSDHQFESKAHFDNCDFSGAIAYMAALLQEVSEHADNAKRANEAHDAAATEAAVRKAFFALGQALHATQDFYAHSNYVELSIRTAKNINDIPLIRPWTAGGKQSIMTMPGLVSGVVFWGFPQSCAKDTPSHHQLAKDTDQTPSGKKRIPTLENWSQYRIAVYLTQQASKDLVVHAFKMWPILKQINGSYVAFDTVIDRRGE